MPCSGACSRTCAKKRPAIAEEKRATELLPVSVDALEGPGMLTALAKIYATVGENAQAIEVLAKHAQS